MIQNHISYIHIAQFNRSVIQGLETADQIYRRATIAYECVGDQLRWGVAVCNPRDRFIKAFGRRIASDALTMHPNSINLYTLTRLAVAGLITDLNNANSQSVTRQYLALAGLNALTASVSKAFEDADNPFDLMSSEFLERTIMYVFEKSTLRRQQAGNNVYGIDFFNEILI